MNDPLAEAVGTPPAAHRPIHLVSRGLVKGYVKGKTAVPVLRGVDLEVRRGELLSVVGPSGSGKSTLLHLLGTLDTPDRGAIYLNDALEGCTVNGWHALSLRRA